VGYGQRAVEGLDLMTDPAAGNFWHGKRVLLTGHTGFKGSWLSLWLRRLGAEVTGIGLEPITDPSLFELAAVGRLVDSHICDVRDAAGIAAIMRKARPEIVYHLAAQPLVRASYRSPLETFSTNVQGTANVLDSIRTVDGVRVVVVVTTDKVYRNLEHSRPYSEDDALGGYDPYSASKAAAEFVTASYRDSFLESRGIAVATARAGNVIGGGDWSEDRLIPDAIRAWSANQALLVRRPAAVRPWQHVLEPLAGYLRLAQCLWHDPMLAGAYNFGPDTHESATVKEVISIARDIFGEGDVEWGDGSDGPHEAGLLALDTTRSAQKLGITPRWGLYDSVHHAIDWYRRHMSCGERAGHLCESDISVFESVASATTAAGSRARL
jgi:CDP-glucose 4,6-dehydratase